MTLAIIYGIIAIAAVVGFIAWLVECIASNPQEWDD